MGKFKGILCIFWKIPKPFNKIKCTKCSQLMEICMPRELVTFYTLHSDTNFHLVLLIFTLLFIQLFRRI